MYYLHYVQRKGNTNATIKKLNDKWVDVISEEKEKIINKQKLTEHMICTYTHTMRGYNKLHCLSLSRPVYNFIMCITRYSSTIINKRKPFRNTGKQDYVITFVNNNLNEIVIFEN